LLTLPPLSLYVHLPWCARKCPYCDFNSHRSDGVIPEADYVHRLLQDLDRDLPHAHERALQSIFIGGGTPSLFSGNAIDTLLRGIRARVAVSPDMEVTLEANPGSAENGKFAAFRAAGVNRLSIGVQSFAPDSLRRLERVHDASEAHAAIDAAQDAGFERINIDLMHGLPQQTVESALADITQALAHGVAHLSWYQLTLEPNTVFYRSPPVLPAEEVLADIQDAGHALLSDAGFDQYEVSAFARGAQQCRHNLNYWQFGDYLGIGAGAHGKLTVPRDDTILRTAKTRSPKDYLNNDPAQLRTEQRVARDHRALEYLMNVLRLKEGGTLAAFRARTGLEDTAIAATVQALRADGLLIADPERLCTTTLGYRFLDSVLQRFLTI
jgi:putative oxygen-independent coproporphyrinogen III oxidase